MRGILFIVAAVCAIQVGTPGMAAEPSPVGQVSHPPLRSTLQDRVYDLRVDDHAKPLVELRRLVRLQRAYNLESEGDLALQRKDYEALLQAYAAAEAVVPDDLRNYLFTRGGRGQDGEGGRIASLVSQGLRCQSELEDVDAPTGSGWPIAR